MSRRRPPLALLAALLSLLLLPAFSGPAAAASVSQTPSVAWYPWMKCASGSGNCAQVRAITSTADGRTWIGGLFTELRAPGGGGSVARTNLAAINADGTVATGIAGHSFNGTIFSLESDGSSVYAGGGFTNVDGSGAMRVARFNASTGARMSFTSGVSGTVFAMDLYNGKLYIGGKFTTVQGASRGNLAALNAGTGAVDGAWTPRATVNTGSPFPNDNAHNNTPIRTLAVDPALGRVYVAGDMDNLNGVLRPAVGAVNPSTGATVTAFTPGSTINTSFQGMQLALADSSGGREPGVVLAMGGLTNRAVKMRTNGSIAWAVNTDGDVQAAAVIGDWVYFGGHFTCVSPTSCYDDITTNDRARMHVAAFRYSSGVNPVADPAWDVKLGPVNSPYYYGVWTLYSQGSTLHAGGVWNTTVVGSTGYGVGKYVRFRG